MTNEKAITLVNDAFGGYYSEWAGTFTEAEKDELAEANRMATAALEQASTAIPIDWIESYALLMDADDRPIFAENIRDMVKAWKQEQQAPTCGPDYCEIGGTHND